MRKKGIVFLLIFLVLVLVLAHFLTDDFLEKQLENTASAIVGAKVEIDDLDLNLFSLQLGWKRLQVTDPNDTWKNLVETGPVKFNVAAEPLLYRRWIIEELRLENLQTGTKRDSDGRLPESSEEKEEPTIIDQTVAALQQELERSTGLDFSALNRKVNVDSIVKLLDLKTPEKIDSLRQQTEQLIAEWGKTAGTIRTLDQQAADIILPVTRIQVTKLKKIDEIIAAIDTLTTAKTQLDSLYRFLATQKGRTVDQWNGLRANLSAVDNWIQSDIQNTLALAKLPDFRVENIATLLFGPELLPRVQKGLQYAKIGYRYGKKLAPTGKVKSPPRFRGQDIPFPDRRHMPTFWLKTAFLSGITGSGDRSMKLSGSLKNVTSQPKIVGQPLVLELSGLRSDQRALRLFCELDRTADQNRDHFSLSLQAVPVRNVSLSGKNGLPSAISSAQMDTDFDLQILGGDLNGRLTLKLNDLRLQFADPQGAHRAVRLVQEVFAGVQTADFRMEIKGKPGNLKIGLRSNLDRILADRFRNVLSSELVRARSQLEEEVKRSVMPKVNEYRSFFEQNRKKVDAILTTAENQLKEKQQLLDSRKKELEKRLEEEKKKQEDALKKEAEKKIKGLLKKIKK